MMRLLAISAFPLLLLSCSTSSIKNDSDATTNFKTLDTLVPFAGFWINERYVNDLQKSKSPRESQGEGESCIEIPTRTLEATRMVWSFHDGGADLAVVKDGNKYQFYYTSEDSLMNFAQDIEIISENKIKIADQFFIKSNRKFLEELLFSGQYLSDNGSAIEFTRNGQVKGFDNYKIYEPVFDYFDAGLNIDQVALGETDKDKKYFAFKFSADTLLIYNLACAEYDSSNNFCTVVDYGSLAYRLTKKN